MVRDEFFFDDRGYDASVGDYVLGVVVPIRHDGEIIGILKSNINIIGAIGKILGEVGTLYEGSLSLVRSGGQIVYQEGVEPLAREVDPSLADLIRDHGETVERLVADTADSLVAFSHVHISEGSRDYGFGGSHESIDHIKGNSGERWLVMAQVGYRAALQTAASTIRSIFGLGLTTVLVLAGVAYLFGNRMSKPIVRIAQHTASVRAHSFDIRYDGQSNDEIGVLGESVNSMTEDLHRYSVRMEEMVSERTHALEKALEEIKSLQGIIPICSYCKQIRNDEGAWEKLEHYLLAHTDALFSHGICPECYKKQMGEPHE